MSKIEELINQCHPNGISMRSLGEFAKETTKRNLKNKDLLVHSVSNEKGLVLTTDYFENIRTSEDISNYKIVEPNAFVYNPARINVGSIARNSLGRRIIVSPMYIVFEVNPQIILPEFFEKLLGKPSVMQYILGSTEVGARFRFPFDTFSKMKLFIPSLEVQIEIVSILDKFKELERELERELEARKTQYEFYRDEAFSDEFQANIGFTKKKLSEVGKFSRGKGIQKSDLVSEGKPAIHYGQIHTKYNSVTEKALSFIKEELWKKSNRASKGDLVLATTSEDIKDVCKPVVWLGDDQAAVSADAMIFQHKLDPLYICYFFQSKQFGDHKYQMATGTKVKRISSEKMGKISLNVPSIKEQERIGSLIFTMESLYLSSVDGLPAEIEARRKQYEYYRNKLLTFKELKSA
jgi:type I restriction enzyme S subunit